MDSVRSTKTPNLVNDFSAQNPTPVWTVITPDSVAAVAEAVARSTGPISIGGGRFSLGGQVASPESLHLDLRQLNQVVTFSPLARTIRVQAGIRWRELLRFIDPHDLSVSIALTHSNFTVGGSLSVNAHGATIGRGPIVDSVRALTLVMADGAVVEASRERNAELFFAAIGGYGAIGVIVEAELELVPNAAIRRVVSRLPAAEYVESLRARRPQVQGAVFHQAEFLDRGLSRLRAVTWYDTDEPVTEPGRLQLPGDTALVGGSLGLAISENALTRWQHEYLSRPLADLRKVVHWRNFEISYDVVEALSAARPNGIGFLQELMVPIGAFETFMDALRATQARHRIENLRVQVRHVSGDDRTLLGWARGETLCLMISQRARRAAAADSQTEVWGRELIDAAIDCGGAPALCYRLLLSTRQFHSAYPRALELFALKARIDPANRFRNALWDRCYDTRLLPQAQLSLDGLRCETPAASAASAPSASSAASAPSASSAASAASVALVTSVAPVADAAGSADRAEFRQVFSTPERHDGFYRFLQNIYTAYPEDRFHSLIRQLSAQHGADEAVYRNLVRELPRLRPGPLQLLRSIPALRRHKEELALQTVEFLGSRRTVNGLMEIGSNGRYLPALAGLLRIHGPVVSVNERRPGFGLQEWIERGSLARVGQHVPLNGYAPLDTSSLPVEGFDLVLCYIGLHHCPPRKLDDFLASVVSLLRPGGTFVLRDHDVPTIEQRTFVSLAHTVCNAGDGMSWEENVAEPRHFAPVSWWSRKLESHGLVDSGFSMPQMDDPSDNVLMAFVKA